MDATLGGLAATDAGSGGGGGDAGMVSLDAAVLNVQTTGNNAGGVIAQSIGGGGGSAGSAVNDVQGGDIGLNFAVGGSGGAGGDGGEITLTIDGGTIITSGDNSSGITAQSIGGGGGSATHFVSGTNNSDISINGVIGGTGGSGGDGGIINLENSATIQTTGENAVAIYVQSVGGGGGETSLAAPVEGGSNSISGTLEVGGKAGGGGSAKDVNVENNGLIVTTGSQSHGLYIESIGGGGGRVTVSTASESEDTNASIALGASGGAGGNAGNVTVKNTGNINVLGDAAYGIFAKSVGGGGGAVSSTAAVNAMIGSSGGSGGNSGDIDITNATVEQLQREEITQSAFTPWLLEVVGETLVQRKGSVSLGATGGSGGSAGDITITNEGSIRTYGDNSYGIIANSIGGGGGRIAGNISNGSITLGASGGARGSSGDITINNSGDISTFGENSIPLQLSSIGGGGGNGGSGYENVILGGTRSGGRSGRTELINTGTLLSNAEFSPAISYQSIGGGGGSVGNLTGRAQLGAQATNGVGNSQAMALTNEGTLITLGDHSPTIFVQSIGGGGGWTGDVNSNARLGSIFASELALQNSADISVVSTGTAVTTSGTNSAGIAIQSTAGGGGWVGSVGEELTMGARKSEGEMNAGSINVVNSSLVKTFGETSPGISIQSIGGGGGYAGSVKGNAQFGSTNNTGSQSAGNITLQNSGGVVSTGAFSPLINVQSIGGGGGRAGDISGDANLGAINMVDLLASGGDINVRQTGEYLISTGENSPALVVQSVGGGGGGVAMVTKDVTMGATGSGIATGGNVDVINQSIIETYGGNSIGLLVQSVGGGGGFSGMSSGDNVILGGSIDGDSSGGSVNASNEASITTLGINSAGFLAQSIGGGGGATAKSDGLLSRLGGESSTTANSGGVVINNGANIATTGTGSPALMAQSIAGGGGYIAETTSQGSYDVTLAGKNLSSANSGKVSVTNRAERLDTLENYSPAFVAQSIGGGGGWSLLRSTPNAQLGSVSGGWQNADDVEVINTSIISTAGDFSAAGVTQSIGGGGGVTGNALGNVTLGASQTRSRLTSGNVVV